MKALVTIILIIMLANITGCNVFSNSSQKTKETLALNSSQNDSYVVISGDLNRTKKLVTLKTVASWSGDESKKIKFKASKSPWVINSGARVTSNLGSKFEVRVLKEINSVIGIYENSYGNTLIEETGEFVIEVESSGCEWWVKIGIE